MPLTGRCIVAGLTTATLVPRIAVAQTPAPVTVGPFQLPPLPYPLVRWSRTLTIEPPSRSLVVRTRRPRTKGRTLLTRRTIIFLHYLGELHNGFGL
jgi:hypothetical protein